MRFHLYLMILPLVIASFVTSNILSSLGSQIALTRLANRHLAFVAEQLRDYFQNEWAVLVKLGLDDQVEYRTAVVDSFRSYTMSLLRSPTELIVVYNAKDLPIMMIEQETVSQNGVEALGKRPEGLREGWFSGELAGTQRVGVAFHLDAVDWTVAVTEQKDSYFSDVVSMQRTNLLIFTVTVAVLAVLLTLFIGFVIRPVERLTETIVHITESNDLSQRAKIEAADEVGVLAFNFNRMISSLERKYRELEEKNLAEREARKMAVARELETLNLLGKVSEFRDENTGEHLKRIGVLSALLTELLGLDENQRLIIANGSPLHDIGKIAIPDSILLKKERLTPEEFETMKRHTVLGHALLKDTTSVYLAEGAVIALSHHEKWDGSGYPFGLAGTDIPLSGRIVGLVDVFDALMSQRPYKEAWSPKWALELIIDQRGKHFDPQLVDLFVENFAAFRAVLEK